jgi:hypothetical protein
MKRLCAVFLLVIAGCISAAAQTCPQGMVCLSQAAANQAAQNARELDATRQKVTVLETALTDKDKIITEIQTKRDEAIGKLTDQNTKLMVDIAQKTGEIIKCDAFAVRDAALIEYLVKNQRSKQQGLINFKLGGN